MAGVATLLYEQNFGAGPSAFCVIRRWELRDSGANDAPDALYADMIAAESNDVLVGLGPGGENVLSRKVGGDASNAGCWLSIPGPATASPGTSDDPVGLSVAEGWIEVGVCPRAAYLAENNFAPLLEVNANGGPGGWFTCEWDGSVIGGNKLKFDTNGATDFSLDYSHAVDMAALADQWQKVVIAFKSSSAPGVADGYARLFFGPYSSPSLIYDHSNIVVSSGFGYPGNNIRGAYLGFAGMIGDMTNLRVYSGVFGDAPPVDLSTPCCDTSTPGGTTGGGASADAPDPVGTLPPWTASCTGAGAVDAVDDLNDGEELGEGAAKEATAWVRVDLVPSVGDARVWQASTRPYLGAGVGSPATPWDGKKVATIESWGDLERALSDRRGSPEVGTFSFVVFDKDGFWRGQLNGETTRYLTTQDVTFYLASVAAHTSHVEPRVAFRGQIKTPAPLPQRRFRLDVESRLGAGYGPFDLDGKVLKRTYGDSTAGVPDFKNLPRQFAKSAVPFLWGEQSDKGTTAAPIPPSTVGEDVSLGTVEPTYCGDEFLGSTAGDPPVAATYALPPTNLRYSYVGSGGVRINATIGVSLLATTGGETTQTILHVPDYPRNPVKGSLEVDWAWDDPNPAGTAKAYKVWFEEGYVDHPKYCLDIMNNGASWVNPEKAYVDDADDSHFKTLNGPPPLTNTAQIAPGSAGTADRSFFYGWFNLLAHPGKITQLKGSNLASGGPAKYVDITAAEIGDDWTSGKPFLFGPNGVGVTRVVNGRAYFGFWGKTGNGKVEAHKSGDMPFRVNLCGWHVDNDTANPIIDQAFSVYQDVYTQLMGNAGAGYQTGDRLTIPSFRSAPTIPILQSSTYAACQALSAEFLEDGVGYRATVYLDDADLTWRQFETDMNLSFGCDSGENHHGQRIVALMDDLADPDTGLLLKEFTDILRVEDAGEVKDDEIENVQPHEFDWHPIDKKYRSGVLTITDDLSIAQYGRRPAPETIGRKYTRDPATASDVAARRLGHYAIAPTYPAVVTKYRKAIRIELGQQYRIQHSDLVSPDPIPCYLTRHGISKARNEVRLTGRDRTQLLATLWNPTIVEDADLTDIGTIYDDTEVGVPVRIP